MVGDIRPAIGAVVTLARFLWGVAGSKPARAVCAQTCLSHVISCWLESVRVIWHCPFMFVFLVEGTFINRLFGVTGISLRGERNDQLPAICRAVVGVPVKSIDCQLDGWWLMVQCLAKTLLLFKSLIPHFKS